MRLETLAKIPIAPFKISSKMACEINWVAFLKVFLLLLLLAAITCACFTILAEKVLKDFLEWVELDLGPWGPLALSVVYVPLTILAVPASTLSLGGGYLFGLPVGFVAESVGSVLGAGSAFFIGRTLGKSLIMSKINGYPQFHAVAIAIQRSGFKIVLLLRLAPLLPLNMLNYLLSLTPVSVADYLLASWLGMAPITLALVYVGTTMKDLSDITHGWNKISKTRWAFIVLSLSTSATLMWWVTRVAKDALEKAVADRQDIDHEAQESPLMAA